MTVEDVEGSFKLNQHKSDADHVAIATALAGRRTPAARVLAQRNARAAAAISTTAGDTNAS